MTSDGYEFIKYRPEFKDQVSELLTVLWSNDPNLNKACFEWKHERNPYQKEPFVYLCLHKGHVVGTTSFCAMPWEIGDPPKKFILLCACDSAIYPDQQDKGLFRQINLFSLQDIVESGYEYIYSLSAIPITFFSFMLVGWRSAGRIEISQFQNNNNEKYLSSLRSLAEKWPFLRQVYHRALLPLVQQIKKGKEALPPAALFDAGFKHGVEKEFQNITVQSSPRPSDMADLINRLGNDGRLRQTRDEMFFNWRFHNPRRNYRFIFWDDQNLEGYLILSFSRVGEATIVDWEASSLKAREELLQTILKIGELNKFKIWTNSLDEELMVLLKKYGFEPIKKTGKIVKDVYPSLILKSVTSPVSSNGLMLEGVNLMDLSNWDLRAIYSDGN